MKHGVAIATLIGALASLLSIIVFFSGKQSLPEMFAKNPSVDAKLRPSVQLEMDELGGSSTPRFNAKTDKNNNISINNKTCINGKIVSMYSVQGQAFLHIDLPKDHHVTQGCSGVVLSGDGPMPISGGEFVVDRVSEGTCLARTALQSVSDHRRVCITCN